MPRQTGSKVGSWKLETGSRSKKSWREVLREKRTAKSLFTALHLKLNPSQGKHEFIIKSKLKVNKTEEPTTRANPKNISKETRSWVVGVVFADTRYKIIFDQDEIQRGWQKQRPA